MGATNTQKFTVIQNRLGCSCPQTTDACSAVECWIAAAPECGRADLKLSSGTSKHYLSPPSLFPVLRTQCKQNTKIIIHCPPHVFSSVLSPSIDNLEDDGVEASGRNCGAATPWLGDLASVCVMCVYAWSLGEMDFILNSQN